MQISQAQVFHSLPFRSASKVFRLFLIPAALILISGLTMVQAADFNPCLTRIYNLTRRYKSELENKSAKDPSATFSMLLFEFANAPKASPSISKSPRSFQLSRRWSYLLSIIQAHHRSRFSEVFKASEKFSNFPHLWYSAPVFLSFWDIRTHRDSWTAEDIDRALFIFQNAVEEFERETDQRVLAKIDGSKVMPWLVMAFRYAALGKEFAKSHSRNIQTKYFSAKVKSLAKRIKILERDYLSTATHEEDLQVVRRRLYSAALIEFSESTKPPAQKE